MKIAFSELLPGDYILWVVRPNPANVKWHFASGLVIAATPDSITILAPNGTINEQYFDILWDFVAEINRSAH